MNEFPRDFVGISLAEQPGKYFLVIRGQRLVVEAESSIQMIMEKLQSYKTRVALNFEVKLFLPDIYTKMRRTESKISTFPFIQVVQRKVIISAGKPVSTR